MRRPIRTTGDFFLDELRRLSDDATPGPWAADSDGSVLSLHPREVARWTERCRGAHVSGCPCPGCRGIGAIVAESMQWPDRRFVAATRNALPMLVDEVDALRRLVDDLRRKDRK